MNRSTRKPTSYSIVLGSSPSGSAHCMILLPFPLSFPYLPFLSSSFSFFFSLIPFLYFPFCSSSPKLYLFHSISPFTKLILHFSILVTRGFHVSSSQCLPFTSYPFHVTHGHHALYHVASTTHMSPHVINMMPCGIMPHATSSFVRFALK